MNYEQYRTYAEKLKDPRWLKKREEMIFLADGACESCGRRDQSLDIHHKYYDHSREPWDYLWSELMCLCRECHERTEHALKEARKLMADFDWKDISGFIEDFNSASLKSPSRISLLNFMRLVLTQPELVKKFCGKTQG